MTNRLLPFLALSAAVSAASAAHVGDGTVSCSVASARINSNVTVGLELPSTRVQLFYNNNGTVKSDGHVIFVNGVFQDFATPPTIPMVFKPGRFEPADLRIDLVSLNASFDRDWLQDIAGVPTVDRRGRSTAANFATKLIPAVNSVIDNGDGTLTASFGYSGNWTAGVTYPVTAKKNQLNTPGGSSQTGLVPSIFRAGTHSNEFQVTFPDNKKVKWNVAGSIVEASADNLIAANG